MNGIIWHVEPFARLTGREVHDIMRLRVDVFVVEQRCVYPEVDGQDPGAQAGLPTSGRANVPDVPCDGKSHQITLVATSSSDKSVQQTQTVGPLYGAQ